MTPDVHLAADSDVARLRTALSVAERDAAQARADAPRLWESSRDLLLVLGPDAAVRAANPAWATLGWHEAALVGTALRDLLHDDDAPAALRTLASGRDAIGFEARLRAGDGAYRSIAWTVTASGGALHLTGRDPTEMRARATALKDAEAQLRQAQRMEAVGQLTGGIAHDFNNLLTIIRSSTDLLRRPDLPDIRRTRYLDAIAQTSDRAAKLTGQLLAFARRQALKPEIFDVACRIATAAEMLASLMGPNVAITTRLPAEPAFVEADLAQFETALINVAANARDAMAGAGALTIELAITTTKPPIRGHAAADAAFVALSLADTGDGIPADCMARVFEPFFTTKEVGRGTGLGLSHVYGFAKQSGGDVTVESAPGKGTRFTLYLPRVAAPAPARNEAPGPVATAPTLAGGGRRLLVVEDNLDVGAFSTQLLEDLGYTTRWAASGGEALRLLEGGLTVDAVFSDVVMPGMSGIELGEAIRRRWPALPVILTSGYSHVLAEEGRHGFDLIQKPYAVEQLAGVLARVVPLGDQPNGASSDCGGREK